MYTQKPEPEEVIDPNPRTSIAILRDWEIAQARKMRGGCNHCGHSWRPRNPSPRINRCPACQMRGTTTITVIEQPDKLPSS